MIEEVNNKNVDVVTYVEPNWEMNYTNSITTDGQNHEQQMNLSDLCVAVDLEVEVVGRNDGGTANDGEPSRLYCVTWLPKDGSKVSFMSGTKIYNDYSEKENGGVNSLTTSYADAYYYDNTNYGFTELFGINDINIKYTNMMIPEIEMTFTDVRGLALFSKAQAREDSYLNGVSEKEAVTSFFHCFFTFPYPKFRIMIKGFYGQSVNYELTCADFKASFKPESGDFEAKVKFVGHSFSFFTDVSILALISAPYSFGLGEEYWKSQLGSRFRVGNEEMRTLVELLSTYDSLYAEATEMARKDDTVDKTMKSSEIEASANELKGTINSFINDAYKGLSGLTWEEGAFFEEKGAPGKPVVMMVNPGDSGQSNDFEFPFLIAVTKWNPNTDTDPKIVDYQTRLDEAINKSGIKEKVTQYNNAYGKNYKIRLDGNKKRGTVKHFQDQYMTRVANYKPEIFKNVPRKQMVEQYNFFTPNTHFKENEIIWKRGIQEPDGELYDYKITTTHIDNRSGEIMNDIERTWKPKKEVKRYITLMLNHITEHYGYYSISPSMAKAARKVLERNGFKYGNKNGNFYLSVIEIGNNFDLDRDVEKARVSPEEESASNQRIREAINERLANFISLKSITKVIMAHFETFMYMMYRTVSYIKNNPEERKPSTLGISSDNLSNVPDVRDSNTVVPPFPRIVVKQINENGVEREEESWPGAFGGTNWEEVNLVNSILKGVDSYAQSIVDMENEGKEPTKTSVLTTPTNFGDLYLMVNPFHIDEDYDITSKVGSLAKEITTRAIAVSLSGVEDKYDASGRADAVNFNNAVNGSYDKTLKTLITNKNSNAINADLIINIALNNGTDNYQGGYGYKPLIVDNGSVYSWNMLRGNTTRWFPYWLYQCDNYDFNDTSLTNYNYYDEYAGDNASNLLITTDVSKLQAKVTQTDATDFKDMFAKLPLNSTSGKGAIFGSILSNTASITNVFGLPDNKKLTYKNRQISKLDSDNLFLKETADVWGTSTQFDVLETIDGETKIYQGSTIECYFDDDSFQVNVDYATIQSFYGFDENGSIIKNKSIFTQRRFYDYFSSSDANANKARMALILLSLELLNYDEVLKNSGNMDSLFVPKACAYQIGAMLWLKQNYGVNSWVSKILNKLSWRKSAEQFVGKYCGYLEIKFLQMFDEFTLNNFKSLFNVYGFDKSAIKEIYNANLSSLVGDKAIEALAPILSQLKENYIAIGTEIDDNGFRLANSENYLLNMLIKDFYVPLLILPLNKYALSENKDIIPSINKDNLRLYLENFLEQLRIEINNGTDGNENFVGADNSPLESYDTDTTEDVKISLYSYLKLLYDKWIPSATFEEWKIENFFPDMNNSRNGGHNFYFIDSYYEDIGDKIKYNYEKFITHLKEIISPTNYTNSLYDFLSRLYAENKCNFIVLQNFLDISKKNNMVKMFQPISYNEMAKDRKHPDFIVMMPYEASSHLDIDGADYPDDSFMLNGDKEAGLPLAIQTRSGSDGFYTIPAFGVAYGKQYQHYFTSVELNMDSPQTNEVSLKTKFQIAKAARNSSQNGDSITFNGQDLFSIYSTNSYQCSVTMMGCAWVQPLMYFVLLNVPMFRGSYLIQSVTHSISQGSMITKFTGTRMARTASRLTREAVHVARSGDPDLKQREWKMANITNDCEYRVYPLFEDKKTGRDYTSFLTKSNISKASSSESNLDTISRIVVRETGYEHKTSIQLMGLIFYNYVAKYGEDSGAKKIIDAFYENRSDFRKTSINKWNETPSDKKTLVKEWIRELFENPMILDGVTPESFNSVSYDFGKTKRDHSKDRVHTGVLDEYKLRHIIGNTSTSIWESEQNNKIQGESELLSMSKAYAARGGGVDSVYLAFSDNIDYWSEIVLEEPDQSHTKDEVVNAFKQCLQKTMRTNHTLECELSFEKYNNSDDTIKITQSNQKNDKLYLVHDVIINGYSKNAAEVNWVTDDTTNENPKYLIVKVTEQISRPKYYVSDTNGNKHNPQGGKGFCKNIYLTAMKKLGSNFYDNNNRVDFTYLKNINESSYNEIIEEHNISIEDCNSLISYGNSDISGQLLNDNMVIGDGWNASKAANYLIANARRNYEIPPCGKCAMAVKSAISYGGQKYPGNSDGWKVYSDLVNNHGWKIIQESNNINAILDKAFVAHVGDVVCERYQDSSEIGHICMFCGSQDGGGWISDYKQNQCAANSNNKTGGSSHYWLLRYQGGNIGQQETRWPTKNAKLP